MTERQARKPVNDNKPANDETTEVDSFDPALLEDVRNAFDLLETIGAKRDALNAEKKAALSKLKAQHMNSAGITLAMQYCRLDDRQRINFDITYQFVRRALGMPVQADLFEATVAHQAQKHTEEKKRARSSGH